MKKGSLVALLKEKKKLEEEEAAKVLYLK